MKQSVILMALWLAFFGAKPASAQINLIFKHLFEC